MTTVYVKLLENKNNYKILRIILNKLNNILSFLNFF